MIIGVLKIGLQEVVIDILGRSSVVTRGMHDLGSSITSVPVASCETSGRS